MKPVHLLLALVLPVMGEVLPAVVADDAPPALPAGTTQADRLTEYIYAIRRAPDPSAAVTAYAQAVAVDRRSLAPAEAYVHRMIELGAPEMAESQARDLTRRKPTNGLAWGVVALGDARRGQFVTALNDIVTAAQHAPDDPFVQATAAQLLAWYDTMADASQVSADLQHSLTDTRARYSERKEFTDEYARAKDYYEQMKAEQQDAGANNPGATPGAPAQPPAAPPRDTGITDTDTTVIVEETPSIYRPYVYSWSYPDWYLSYPLWGRYSYLSGMCIRPAEPFFGSYRGPFFRSRGFDGSSFPFRGRHGFLGFPGPVGGSHCAVGPYARGGGRFAVGRGQIAFPVYGGPSPWLGAGPCPPGTRPIIGGSLPHVPSTAFIPHGPAVAPMRSMMGRPMIGSFGGPTHGSFGGPTHGSFGGPGHGSFGGAPHGSFGGSIGGYHGGGRSFGGAGPGGRVGR